MTFGLIQPNREESIRDMQIADRLTELLLRHGFGRRQILTFTAPQLA